MFTINDFMAYASTGKVPTVYSKQQAAKSSAPALRSRSNFSTMTAPTSRPVALVPQPMVPVTVTTIAKQPLELANYSDRSFAIFGDTKPMQAQLEALGGKFNPWLKRSGKVTPGYIFSINRIDAVRKSLNL